MLAASIADTLIKELDTRGIKARVRKLSQSGSVYIGFDDTRIGQLRIGDHNERDRYGYRWQVRLDLERSTPYTDSEKGHSRFFYSAYQLPEIAERIKKYHEAIIRNSTTGIDRNEKTTAIRFTTTSEQAE